MPTWFQVEKEQFFLTSFWGRSKIAVHSVFVRFLSVFVFIYFIYCFILMDGNGLVEKHLLQILYLNDVGLEWVRGLLWLREIMGEGQIGCIFQLQLK